MSTKYFIVTTTKPYVCAIPDTKQNYVYSVIALWLTVGIIDFAERFGALQ